jgi:hypothetical protein
MKLKNKLKKFTSILLSLSFLTTTFVPTYIYVAYADSDEGNDDDFDTDDWDPSEITDDEDWDHETWDEEHQEQVWTSFQLTEWSSNFPSLQFSKDGTSTLSTDAVNKLSNIDGITYDEIVSTITSCRIRGSYTVVSNGTYDNSKYVNLVCAVLVALRESGKELFGSYHNGNDPFCYKKYMNSQASKYYTTADTRFTKSVDAITRAVINAVSGSNIYDESSLKEPLNGLTGKGTKKAISNFSDKVLDYYDGFKNADTYSMDGFGNRLDSLTGRNNF